MSLYDALSSTPIIEAENLFVLDYGLPDVGGGTPTPRRTVGKFIKSLQVSVVANS